ncbi:MAG: 3'(2'),5'-bisphosphate nucleotidase CysQ [Schleiferiaceae bacterium]
MEALLEIAVKAAIAGGEEILKVYDTDDFGVEVKGDNSPLTKADKAAHLAIVSYLNKTDVPILSEEGKHDAYVTRSGWETLWIVDPLDGTKEFIKRNGEFTVNIALVKNGKPVAGVIYVPVKKTLYFASLEMGAFKCEAVEGSDFTKSLADFKNQSMALPVSKERPFTIVGSRSHMSPETEEYIRSLEAKHGSVEVMSVGSSLKICMVAEGSADEYPRFAPTMEWDTAAGQAIAEGAGFRMLQGLTEEPVRYNKEDLLNPWFIVKR